MARRKRTALAAAPSSLPVQPAAPPDKPRVDLREIGQPGATVFGDLARNENELNEDFQFPQSLDRYEAMRCTPVIAGLLKILELSVLGDEWSVVPAAKDPSAYATVAAARLEENLRAELEWRGPTGNVSSQSFDDVLRNYLLCLPFGFSFDEICWRYQGDQVAIAKLAPRLPRSVNQFISHPDNPSDLEYIQQNVYHSRYGWPKIPANKITLCVFNREGDNFTGRSLLRPLWQPYFIKDGVLRVQAMAVERNGMGVPQALAMFPDARLSGDDRTVVEAIVRRWRAGDASGVVMPPGYKIELTTANTNATDNINLLQYLDRQQAIALVLMILTAGLDGGGAYAQSQTHDSISQRVVGSIKQQIAGYINNGFVYQWWRLNFEGKCRRPEFQFANRVYFTLNELLDIIGKLTGSQLFVPSEPDEEWIRQQLNLPKKETPVVAPPPNVIVPPSPPVVPVQPVPDVEAQDAPPVAAPSAPAQKKSPDVWRPRRELNASEQNIKLSEIYQEQNNAIAEIVNVVNEYLPAMMDAAAKAVTSAETLEDVTASTIPEPSGLVDDIVAILQGLSDFSAEQIAQELNRLGK